MEWDGKPEMVRRIQTEELQHTDLHYPPNPSGILSWQWTTSMCISFSDLSHLHPWNSWISSQQGDLKEVGSRSKKLCCYLCDAWTSPQTGTDLRAMIIWKFIGTIRLAANGMLYVKIVNMIQAVVNYSIWFKQLFCYIHIVNGMLYVNIPVAIAASVKTWYLVWAHPWKGILSVGLMTSPKYGYGIKLLIARSYTTIMIHYMPTNTQ